MDEHDKKDLEEAVEEAIKKHEEKRKGIHSMEKAPKIEKKNKMKHIDAILMLGIVAVLLVWGFWPVLMPGEVEQGIVIMYPANVVLDSFEDSLILPMETLHMSDGDDDGWPLVEIDTHKCAYVNVIFQLNNTGDEIAKDVSCFVKCCDQNGTILFSQLFTFDDLGPNSTASGEYKVYIWDLDEAMYVTHNIEVRWSPQGVNTYVKLTEM